MVGKKSADVVTDETATARVTDDTVQLGLQMTPYNSPFIQTAAPVLIHMYMKRY
jgi:hypothetical protein